MPALDRAFDSGVPYLVNVITDVDAAYPRATLGSEPKVRPRSPAEYAAVTEITVAAYVDGGFLPADSAYVRELGDTLTRAAGAEIWVADRRRPGPRLRDLLPAGSTWREIAADDEGEFRMLAVARDARGRGVGEALVRACLDRGPGGRPGRGGHLHDGQDDGRPPAL